MNVAKLMVAEQQMLRIDRDKRRFVPLARKPLSELGLLERQDIQRMIRESADAFFGEMGEPLKLIGEEITPSDFVQDRIDLLAIDSNGTAVIIELKRSNNKLHLLQALAYAGMIAKWEPGRFSQEFAKIKNSGDQESLTEELELFLEEGDTEAINRGQRIILIAEEFDWEVLVAAEWLYESYDVDIRCYRLSAATDGEGALLTCTCIFPPPELTRHAIRRGSTGGKPPRPARWDNWETALKGIENEGIRKFYEDELAHGQWNYLRRRTLRYRINDRHIFNLQASRGTVYVWQRTRFPNDVQFWVDRLGKDCDAEPVKNGQALRFYLRTGEDCRKFKDAVENALQSIRFTDGGSDEDQGDDEVANA